MGIHFQPLLDFFKYIASILKYVVSIGGIGFCFFLWDRWKNRNRILVHSAEIKTNEIKLLLENLSSQPNSIKRNISIVGTDIREKVRKEIISIHSEVKCELPCSTQVTLPISHDLKNIVFLWFITITIYPTKSRAFKIRFRNANKRLNSIRFFYEYLRFKRSNKIYEEN